MLAVLASLLLAGGVVGIGAAPAAANDCGIYWAGGPGGCPDFNDIDWLGPSGEVYKFSDTTRDSSWWRPRVIMQVKDRATFDGIRNLMRGMDGGIDPTDGKPYKPKDLREALRDHLQALPADAVKVVAIHGQVKDATALKNAARHLETGLSESNLNRLDVIERPADIPSDVAAMAGYLPIPDAADWGDMKSGDGVFQQNPRRLEVYTDVARTFQSLRNYQSTLRHEAFHTHQSLRAAALFGPGNHLTSPASQSRFDRWIEHNREGFAYQHEKDQTTEYSKTTNGYRQSIDAVSARYNRSDSVSKPPKGPLKLREPGLNGTANYRDVTNDQLEQWFKARDFGTGADDDEPQPPDDPQQPDDNEGDSSGGGGTSPGGPGSGPSGPGPGGPGGPGSPGGGSSGGGTVEFECNGERSTINAEDLPQAIEDCLDDGGSPPPGGGPGGPTIT